MSIKTGVLSLISFTALIYLTIAPLAAEEFASLEPFKKEDRILVLAPHPDDENIGCGGVIQRAVKTGAQVKVAYLTNGDHNEFAFMVYEKRPVLSNPEFIRMGKVREEESKKAMKILGLDESNLIFLGYPDYGTDTIFFSFWDSTRPFESYLTRQSYVPYKESPSYNAPYKAETILKDLKKVLLDYRPNKIFVSHPADVNGDHWAYYCFLQVALRDLQKEIPEPRLYVYFVHAPGWPLPRHYHPELVLEPSSRHFPDSLIKWVSFQLTPEEIDKKYKAMLCYRSQTCVSAFYLLSFVRQNELFGDYPLFELERQASPDKGNIFNDNNRLSYAVAGDSFWIRVRKPQELKKRIFFSIYILGYSDKVPFAKMPNIWVRTKSDRFKITELNTAKEVNPAGTLAQVKRDFFILKIPLRTLGDPQFILTSLVTDKPFLPLDATGFRRIKIKDEEIKPGL
ncbi:MAG: PIG-L family deacetylase [Candidatus Omnitrophota bacterium]